jgi:cell division protein FtsB
MCSRSTPSGRIGDAPVSRPSRRMRPLRVVIYAAFLGVLLASYVAPLQQIFEGRTRIPALEERLAETEEYSATQRRILEELDTPEGIERVARERYGMILPGEDVYIVPKD